MIRKIITRVASAGAFLLLAFVVLPHHAHAATCVPGTGMATLTNSNVSVPSAGSYNVYMRMEAATPLALQAKVEVTPAGGTATCFEAPVPNPSTVAWAWTPSLGTVNLTAATGNTIKIVGVSPGVRVDRLILVSTATPCTPSNTRNTSVSPILEPGDNCIVASSTTTSTTISPSTSGDKTLPVGPASLNAVPSPTSVALSWPAATDNVAVTQYVLTRNGTPVYTGTNLNYTDTGLTMLTSYTYQIVAKDAAGNTSTGATKTISTSETTPPPPPPGAITPPGAVSRSLQFDYTRFSYFMDLNWVKSASTVKDYIITRNNSQIGTSTTTNYRDYNVLAGTLYSYSVQARDAAGNISTASKTSASASCFLIWCWLN